MDARHRIAMATVPARRKPQRFVAVVERFGGIA
jgi:hypothetical protein